MSFDRCQKRVEGWLRAALPRRGPRRRARAWRRLSPLLAAIAVLFAHAAEAGGLNDALDKLADEDRSKYEAAIAEIGTTNEPRGLTVLEGLARGEVYFDAAGTVLLQQAGGHVDAKTGALAMPKPPLRAAPLDNRVRRVLESALAELKLTSPDSAVRFRAAEELSRSANLESLPMLRDALSREEDDDVREVLALGVARFDLASDDAEQRIAAIALIEDAADVSFRPALERLTVQAPDGTFAEPDARVRDAATSALSAIEGRIFWISLVANSLYGLSLGSVLLLAALGLAITFGLMRVINMAHGEMLMLGAYSTFVVQNLFKEHLPQQFDWYIVAAVPAAFAVTMLAGIALERSVIRFLYGRPLETLLATWGLSLVMIQTVRVVFGAQNVTVANPDWLSGGWELMPTVVLPYSRIAVVCFVIVVVAFVYFLLQRTSLGLQVRAVTQNREMAAGMGIATRRVDTLTFGFGSGVAGLGGVALSQLGNVGPELGQSYIVDSFMVVVVGGVGKLAGTVAGAMGLGVLNKYVEPLSGAVLGKILILILLILFIQKRPQGIFALKGRAAEG
jgi:urea transport system permease protein